MDSNPSHTHLEGQLSSHPLMLQTLFLPGRSKHMEEGRAGERSAPMDINIPSQAPDIPSDPSFRLPQGVDPLSAVLLGRSGARGPAGQPTLEEASASDDSKDAENSNLADAAASAAAPAAPAARQLLPQPPASPAAAASPASAVPALQAKAALPGLTPPPWAAAGTEHLSSQEPPPCPVSTRCDHPLSCAWPKALQCTADMRWAGVGGQANAPGGQPVQAAPPKVAQLRQVFEGSAARRPSLGSHRPGYQRPAAARPPPEDPMKEW